MLAVDIDINEQSHADIIENLATATLGRSPFCRFGNGEKRLLLYWIAEPIRKRRSGRWGEHQVEILSRGSQFCAYGMHPDTRLPYEWVEAEPLADDIDKLPEVNEAAVDRFVEQVDSYFADETDLEMSHAGGSVNSGSHDYCLLPSDQFDVTEPALGLLTVAEIKEQIGEATWHCNLTAIRPESESEAGRISMQDGRLRVTDFVDMITYFERVDFDDEQGEILGELLPEPPESGGLFAPDGAAILADLLENYCYVMADDTVRRIDAPALGIKRARSPLHQVRTGPVRCAPKEDSEARS